MVEAIALDDHRPVAVARDMHLELNALPAPLGHSVADREASPSLGAVTVDFSRTTIAPDVFEEPEPAGEPAPALQRSISGMPCRITRICSGSSGRNR